MTKPDGMEITYSGKAARAIGDRPVQDLIPRLSWAPGIARFAYAVAVELETLQMEILVLCGDDPGLLALVHGEAARRGRLIETRALHAGSLGHGWSVPNGRIEGLRSVLDDLRAGRLR